ncbi:MAG: hypothetical protein A2498_01365 [Lentisphaerae bacterium RIFOXYC12_FULL_60_16]|nr:MAG: hypothetical protein A2498_01365 [Lentisphaerae bacterium RIFOXYC12_FULL_60_16]OGV78328.1 MAG: hypothetical protein A2340_15920 [Lentisphaerae bacterium RIFOXYB12_FULL_60_10]
MNEQPKIVSEVSRDLAFPTLLLMSLGMMVGAGVFVSIGLATRMAGPGGMLVAFALNGLLALVTASSFAELSSALPRASGIQEFSRLAVGRGGEFMAGWLEWLVASSACALNALVLAACLGWATQSLVTGLPVDLTQVGAIRWLAILLGAGFVVIQCIGSAETGRGNRRISILQVALILSLGLLAVWVAVHEPVRMENFQPFAINGLAGLLMAMAVSYVAFAGFEVAARAGQEAASPRSDLPRAILYSAYFGMLLYLLLGFAAVVGLSPDGSMSRAWAWGRIWALGETGVVAGLAGLGRWGFPLLVAALVFATVSALHGTLYSGIRTAYGMGRQRLLPDAFARLSVRRQTPVGSVYATGALVLVLTSLLSIRHLMVLTAFLCLVLGMAVNLAAGRIRRYRGDELIYGYLQPLAPLAPLAAMVVQLILLVALAFVDSLAWGLGVVWMAGGWILFRLYARHRSAPEAEDIRILEEGDPLPSDGRYRVMAAVANTDTALSLVRATVALCRARQGTVELVHMVPVPDQMPLSDAEHYLDTGREAIGEMMLYLAPDFPAGFTIRYCRNVARGIVSAAQEKRANLLVLGWRGKNRSHGFALGSTLDPILECAPCNVVVLRHVPDRVFHRVWVPVAGGRNSAFAFEVATMLADPADGVIVVLNVRSGGESITFDLEPFIDEQASRLNFPRERVVSRTVESRRVADTVVEEIERAGDRCDLVVLGASPRSLFNPFTRESMPNLVARRCTKPMAIVNRVGRLRSWMASWL